MRRLFSRTMQLMQQTLPRPERPRPDPDCKHRWRVLGTTELGYATCERCNGTTELYPLMDAMLQDWQDRR
jgi:hypothetical protein